MWGRQVGQSYRKGGHWGGLQSLKDLGGWRPVFLERGLETITLILRRVDLSLEKSSFPKTGGGKNKRRVLETRRGNRRKEKKREKVGRRGGCSGLRDSW